MIELKRVCAGYGGRDVIHDVSFRFETGVNYCLLGPNGCGKTTLLRAMSGLIPHTGEVLLDGARLETLPRRKIAAKIAVMSQINTIYFPYTVYDTVMLGRYQHMKRGPFGGVGARDREAVERCLASTGLSDLRNRLVSELSGGQCQRVFLAHTLAQEPDAILLDEPTNHLDIRHQVELIDYLKDWTADGKHSVVGVFHDMNLALRLTDRALFMKDGRLLGSGRFGEVAGRAFLTELFGMDIAGYMIESLQKWEALARW
ncbi:MAG: ABC transporter ATP-binding protein [Clostridia bacterium]|nr:ABC transporter ATP-binding protein [Clostridia bacterium]MBO4883761.1 ABC transporter ATP-binding protein [Clostridia bacterium]